MYVGFISLFYTCLLNLISCDTRCGNIYLSIYFTLSYHIFLNKVDIKDHGGNKGFKPFLFYLYFHNVNCHVINSYMYLVF